MVLKFHVIGTFVISHIKLHLEKKNICLDIEII